MNGKPSKTLRVSGVADVKIMGDKLEIQATGGLAVCSVTDLSGSVVYMFHPLSGWYVEVDLRNGKEPPMASKFADES